MADKMCENNQVTIMGEIVSDFSYSHEVYGEGFYMVEVSVHRLSSFVDYIPVMVSERLVNVQESAEGKCVYITGQFRSFNRHEEHKNRLVLSVFAREFELVEQFEEENAANQIFLDGFICKESVYRKTPLGREIADLLVAVNRSYGKSDYIPCICWGRKCKILHPDPRFRITSDKSGSKNPEPRVCERKSVETQVAGRGLLTEGILVQN